MFKLIRALFRSREPDYAELLQRKDAHVRVERANGDVIEINPTHGTQRQKNDRQPPQPELHGGRPHGRPNGRDDSHRGNRPR